MPDAEVALISILVIPAMVSAMCSWIAATQKPASRWLAIQVGASSAFLAIMMTAYVTRVLYPPPIEKLSQGELLLVFTIFFGMPAMIAGAAIGAACACAHRLVSKKSRPENHD